MRVPTSWTTSATKPVVALLSNDFEGVAFSCDDWEDFELVSMILINIFVN